MKIVQSPEYKAWLATQTLKSQVQILGRLANVEQEGYFGDYKCLVGKPPKVWELRWKNGRRIYFSFVPEDQVLLLIGGNKHGQKKDIQQAKKILKEYHTHA